MPDLLTATTPLNGHDETIAGTRLAEARGLAIVSLAQPMGGAEGFDKALTEAFDAARPEPGRSTVGADGARVVWTAPDQVFAIFDHDAPDAVAVVGAKTGGAAYLTGQTDNWCALALAGPLARTALERICPIDLHPDAFPVDAAARTVMEHLGALIVRRGDDDYLLLSASSSAGSFLHAVQLSLKNVA